MTTEAFTEVAPYAIAGTGPYAIGHAYEDGAIAAVVELSDGSTVTLMSGLDFSVLPLSGDSGDLTLSTAAAVTYSGETLHIRRRTRAEQGFAGQNAREKGLEANLDRVSMVTQELERQTYRGLRVATGEIEPYDPQDGRPPVWDAALSRFVSGPDQAEVAQAGVHAQTAAAASTSAQASAQAAAISAAQATPTQVLSVAGDRAIALTDANAILRTDQRRFLTLPVPTALGNGFEFSVQGGGCALTPAIGTTIALIGENQPRTSVEVPPGQVAKVFTDGTDWFVYFVNLNHKHVIYIDPIGPDVAFVDVDVPYGVPGFKYCYHSFIPQIDTGYLAIQVGNSGGLEVGGSSYFTMSHGFASGTGTGTTAGGFIISEQGIVPNTPGQEGWGSGRLDRFYSSLPPVFEGRRAGVSAGPTNTSGTLYGRMSGVVPSVADRMRVLCNNGSINGLYMTIEWDI
jgi:hypothetical protein